MIEIERLRKQVTELQRANNREVERRRAVEKERDAKVTKLMNAGLEIELELVEANNRAEHFRRLFHEADRKYQHAAKPYATSTHADRLEECSDEDCVDNAPPSVGWVTDVLEFHRKFDCPIRSEPGFPDIASVKFRYQFLREEMFELSDGIHVAIDIIKIADGLADIIYVAIGMAIEFGIDLRPVWAEVHRSNMAKAGGSKRADGKILKPEGWKPPDIAAAIERGRLE